MKTVESDCSTTSWQRDSLEVFVLKWEHGGNAVWFYLLRWGLMLRNTRVHPVLWPEVELLHIGCWLLTYMRKDSAWSYRPWMIRDEN